MKVNPMTMTTSKVLSYLALIFTIVSVVLAIESQSIEIRNQIDFFMDDLQMQGKWALWGTFSQAIAVGLLIMRALFTGDV